MGLAQCQPAPRRRRGSQAEQVAEMGDSTVFHFLGLRTLQDEGGVDETLQAIVEAAVGTVLGAQYAGLSAVEHRREIHTRASTATWSTPSIRCSTTPAKVPA
jgi:hypothetical protein